MSVRQVGGEGLRKFITSPKLEVVAEIPSEDTESEELDVQAPQTEQQNPMFPESKENKKEVLETKVLSSKPEEN